MSLTVPSGLQTRLPNRSENWVVQLFNSSKTQVNSNTNDLFTTNETDLTVTDGSVFNVDDIIMLHDYTELMKVTRVNSNELDVQRRYMGTAASATLGTNKNIYKRNFIGLSFSAVVLQDQYYEPCILNMPSIRESIDLDAQTSSRSNVSIKIANFTYQGAPFSEQLHNGTDAYLNQLVRIYIPPSQVKSTTGLNNCLQIYEGRLVHIAHDAETITLEINSEEPWKDISIPNVKHEKYNIYQPIVYGDYTPSLATSGTARNAAFATVFPVPKLYNTQEKVWTVMPKAYSSGSTAYLHYYVGFDQFASWKKASSPYFTDTTKVESGVDILGTFVYGAVTGYISTEISDKDPGLVTMFENQENMFDINQDGTYKDNTYASTGSTGSTTLRYARFQTPPRKFHLTGVRQVKVRLQTSGASVTYDVNCFSNQFASLDDNLMTGDGVRITVGSTVQEFEFTFNDEPKNVIRFRYDSNEGGGDGDLTDDDDWANFNYASCPDEILMKFSYVTGGDFGSVQLRITDVRVGYIAWTDTNILNRGETREGDTKILADTPYWYCGADGLHDTQVAGNYWIGGGGSSTNIAKLHQMHRDLLHRFTYLEQTPENWTSLNSQHSWDARLWQLEPTKLSDLLKKIQTEGQFIFRLKNDNTPQYIFVPNNPHADHILTKQDISTFQVSDTDFRSITTKYILNFHKHPAESGKYIQQIEVEDSTPRTLYNIQTTNDNTKTIDFDYLVDDVSAGSNINSSWHNYRKQLFGTVKTIIKCKVINPQFYNMDVGDIVALEDMHIKAFNVDYTDTAFMITSVQRKLGEMDIELREVATDQPTVWMILQPFSTPEEGEAITVQMANQHWKARTMNLELYKGTNTLVQTILSGAEVEYTPGSTSGISWTPANLPGPPHNNYKLRATCLETGSVSESSTFSITPS